jgi:predicted O-methyltransferase YrrM
MMQPLVHEIRNYLESIFASEDELLSFARIHSKNNGLPDIHIPSHVGKILYLLAKIQQSKHILEIGTLGGYSTIWLARALPIDGRLLSIEINPTYVELARLHIQQADLHHCVEIRLGEALTVLPLLIQEQSQLFDFIFIDADKSNNEPYLDLAIQLSRSGTLIIVDNLIPKGEKIGQPCNGEAIKVYHFNQYFANHPSLETVAIPTIAGFHGRLDAMGMARVR